MLELAAVVILSAVFSVDARGDLVGADEAVADSVEIVPAMLELSA